MSEDMGEIYRLFSTDRGAEVEGVFLDYGKGGRIRVARAGGGNKRYLKILERLTEPHRRQIELGIMDREVANGVLRRAFAEGVVLGWDGIKGRDGRDLPFTIDNCVKLFEDLPDLFDDVQRMAGKAAIFREDLREAAAGN